MTMHPYGNPLVSREFINIISITDGLAIELRSNSRVVSKSSSITLVQPLQIMASYSIKSKKNLFRKDQVATFESLQIKNTDLRYVCQPVLSKSLPLMPMRNLATD